MRRAAFLPALLAAVSGAQDQPLVFRSSANLVEFTVVALDKDGHPVTDLTEDDFRVFEQGKARPIAFFRYEGAVEPARPVPPPQPGFASNSVENAPGPARNITAIVLDTLNTTPQDQVWVRAQVTRYLRTLAPLTRVAVFHLGTRLSIVHDFTADVESLRRRLAKSALEASPHAFADVDAVARDAELLTQVFAGSPTIADMMERALDTELLYNAAVARRKTESTLAALDALGEHLAGIPGRKNMVWIGGGISMLAVSGAMGSSLRGDIESFELPVREAARRLARKGIVLYVVDARGLSGPEGFSPSVAAALPRPGSDPYERQRAAARTTADPLPAALKLAAITGGRVIRNTNDPAEGMRQAANDLAGSYTLAFYASAAYDDKWHPTRVEVRRPGVQITARQGFLSDPSKPPDAWTPQDWRRALYNPIGSSAIRLEARCRRPPGEPQGTLALNLRIDASAMRLTAAAEGKVADIDVGIADMGPAGVLSFHNEHGRIHVPSGPGAAATTSFSAYSRTWKAAPETAALRIIVRDRLTGRLGSLDVSLEMLP